MDGEFRESLRGRAVQNAKARARHASKKPLIALLFALFGAPYEMTRLVRVLTESAQTSSCHMTLAR